MCAPVSVNGCTCMYVGEMGTCVAAGHECFSRSAHICMHLSECESVTLANPSTFSWDLPRTPPPSLPLTALLGFWVHMITLFPCSHEDRKGASPNLTSDPPLLEPIQGLEATSQGGRSCRLFLAPTCQAAGPLALAGWAASFSPSAPGRQWEASLETLVGSRPVGRWALRTP